MRLLAFLLTSILLATAVAPMASAQGLTDPNPASTEWLETVLVIAQPDLTTLEISGAITIRKYVVEGTAYETSDDMGDAYQQMLQADEFAQGQGQASNRAESFLADIRANARQALADSLAATYPGAQITIEEPLIDLDTLEAPLGNPFEPGVRLDIAARVVRTADDAGVGDLSEKALEVAFESGARVSATVPFTAAAGHNVLYVLETPASPAGLGYVAASPASIATLDGGLLLVRVDNSAGMSQLEVSVDTIIANPTARAYTADEIARGASVVAVVDLQDIDIELGKAIGGDFGNLLGEVTIRTELGLVELPPEFQGTLPASVELSTLSSNAIRLLRAHGAITQENLDDLERTFLAQVSENLRGALGTAVSVTGGFAPGTMNAAGIESTEGGAPLVLEARATFVKSLSGAPSGTAAIALYTQTQTFDLPRVQGLDTTYTIILPKGLALTDVKATGGVATEGKAEDGRDQFTVSPEGESTKVTASMAITPAFIFAKFLIVILLAVVLLILIVGTPIALVVRSRRRKEG